MNKLLLYCFAIVGYLFLTATTIYAQDNDDLLVEMSGRVFNYKVVNDAYHIQLTFNDESSITWKYLAAPDGLTGKSATETLEREDIRDDVILMAWDEDDGTKVIDVFDLDKMKLYANFVTADGQRFMSMADVTEGSGE